RKLFRHAALFKKLRPVHMSGDETDGPVKTHPAKFRIVEARWQSLEFKTFMRALDTMYREDWAMPVGIRATSGNPPRFRVEEGARVEDGVAPPHLWRNCYDEGWLKSLKIHVLQSLQIIDANYDFTLKG
ncbi:uncharacterized protein B0H18DRAFT_870520, partial [Fomitopsis serialis]|uniref:uncharacterized protein n=1 Tax=Fomitopsis serialis TaxID=139415 RepID=UPI002008C1BC